MEEVIIYSIQFSFSTIWVTDFVIVSTFYKTGTNSGHEDMSRKFCINVYPTSCNVENKVRVKVHTLNNSWNRN